MKVDKDKIISITYELRLDHKNGEVIEMLRSEEPLVFLYGSGNLLPKFEENLSGMLIGDQFDFDLSALEAYGEKDNDAIVDVPLAIFEVDGRIDNNMLQIGNKIPMQDTAGNKLTGTVMSITKESVKMDFNHPLAGNRLFFKGEIIDIREATDDELHHGHAHFTGSCDNCESCGGHDGHC